MYLLNLDIGGKIGLVIGSNKEMYGWFVGFFSVGGKKYFMVVFIFNIELIVKNGDNEDLGGGDIVVLVFKDIV